MRSLKSPAHEVVVGRSHIGMAQPHGVAEVGWAVVGVRVTTCHVTLKGHKRLSLAIARIARSRQRSSGGAFQPLVELLRHSTRSDAGLSVWSTGYALNGEGGEHFPVCTLNQEDASEDLVATYFERSDLLPGDSYGAKWVSDLYAILIGGQEGEGAPQEQSYTEHASNAACCDQTRSHFRTAHKSVHDSCWDKNG